MPVLLTVPCKVIVGPATAIWPSKVFALNAGFEVRSGSGMSNFLHKFVIASVPVSDFPG
jgi:hypothetical protein